jgi:hypothetical protein
MYKAAFPSATPEEEEREMKWVGLGWDKGAPWEIAKG